MFYDLQKKHGHEDEYWAYNTTSLSSYLKTLKQVQYGKNKEGDRLPLKFLVAVQTSLSYVRKEIDQVYDDIRSFENLSNEYELYSALILSRH